MVIKVGSGTNTIFPIINLAFSFNFHIVINNTGNVTGKMLSLGVYPTLVSGLNRYLQKVHIFIKHLGQCKDSGTYRVHACAKASFKHPS